MIPKELEKKIKIVGNASLGGAVRYLLEENPREKIEILIKECEYFELSTSVFFNNAYIENMVFGGIDD